MEDFSKITISFDSVNSQSYHYFDGSVTVELTLRDAAFGVDYAKDFVCHIFAEDYFPMCSSAADSQLNFEWPVCTITMPCSHVWLPGTYTLFIRYKDDIHFKADMIVADDMSIRLDNVGDFEFLDRDDMLTSWIADTNDDWKCMASKPGLGVLRQRIVDHTLLAFYNELRVSNNGRPVGDDKNYIICTVNKDLDDQSIINFHHQINGAVVCSIVDCATLYDMTYGNPYEKLNSVLEYNAPLTFCLTNISALMGTGGKVIVRQFLSKMHGGYNLWLCGTRQEVDNLLEMFPSLGALVPPANRLQLKPYTAFELVEAFRRCIFDAGMSLSAEGTDALADAILKGFKSGSVAAWTVDDIRLFVRDQLCPRYLSRTLADMDVQEPEPVIPDDIPLEMLSDGRSSFEESIRELNEMIGLDNVKQGITTMANRTRFYMERRRRGLHTSDKATFHAIFTGNPGTGKTTVARMLGKIYHSLGLLSKGEVVAVDRTRIVGRFLGETEENMKAIFEEARGNVLFIDEAYTLYDGAPDRKDFGCRAIDCLLTVLTQPNPDMLIVFAGYEKEMETMLSTNPGLFGRFPYKYRFSDYNAEQLMEIACRLIERDEYTLTAAARKELADSIQLTLQQRTKNFGNARWVEQFLRNGIIPALADRVLAMGPQMPDEAFQTIEAVDVRTAYEKFNPRTIELHPRRQIGFSA